MAEVGAEFVVQHDGAAGGVVRDVRAHCLTLGGFPRRTQRRRIVEVRLEHAVIRRLALAGGDVEAVAIAAQAGELRHQWQVRVLVVASEMVRVRRRGIENEEPVHGANCNRPPDSRCAFEPCVRGELNQPRAVRPNHIRTRAIVGLSQRGRQSTHRMGELSAGHRARSTCSLARPRRRQQCSTAEGQFLVVGTRCSRRLSTRPGEAFNRGTELHCRRDVPPNKLRCRRPAGLARRSGEAVRVRPRRAMRVRLPGCPGPSCSSPPGTRRRRCRR